MSPESIQSFLAVALGFAVAGMISTGYQLLTHRPPSFRLLGGGAGPATFAAVPFLAFAAPFIIMRDTIRGVASSGGASNSSCWPPSRRASGA
jgi:hypothetical protein